MDNEVWYIYTKKYYSGIKRYTFESVLKNCMNLKLIVKRGVNQKEKDKYHF